MSTTPTPEEVRAARDAAGLTQGQAAELVYMGHAKRWSEVERGVYAMHPGLWELFRIKTTKHRKEARERA